VDKQDRIRLPLWEIIEYYHVNKTFWDRDDTFWLRRIKEEVEELQGCIEGSHDDPIELELKQIASFAINWLYMIEARKTG